MKEIGVYADWAGLPQRMLMGTLRAERIKGEEIFSFSYAQDWLKSGHAQELDPDLQLFAGPQYLQDEKYNFGMFLDSSPDRWGRTLMEKRNIIEAQQTGNPRRKLFASDYLLGLDDLTRMGALRFKTEANGPFLAEMKGREVPPLSSIRTLEQASLRLEAEDFYQDPQAWETLSLLMAPGSSLGGARPKANVQDPQGQLWIAKFPAKNDAFNSGAWEWIVHQMAKNLGLNVAQNQAAIYSQKHHTFLSKRFDRTLYQERIHFASAMTLLGYKDGYSHKEGGSYLELVELIERFGAQPTKDIRELWQRIVFSVTISNTDDHLRNHGFLLTPNGWILSPAYDLNPNPWGTGLSLNISENDNRLDFALCLEVAPYFRWSEKEAIAWVEQVREEVNTWPNKAKEMDISAAEQAEMEGAFRR